MQTNDRMLVDMNDSPPLDFHGKLLPHYLHYQPEEYSTEMEMKRFEDQDVRQELTSSISTMPLTSEKKQFRTS